MSRRFYSLPPFTTLSAFEAAARHLSFKNAAKELGVTPGAVSHQIKALEAELSVSLFHRQHRGVTLTPEGDALHETLATSYRQIAQQLARLRHADGRDVVTVGCTTAVASLWLSPSLIRFWRRYPDVQINQVAQDWPFSGQNDLDFFICYGKSPEIGLTQVPVYRDTLVPVTEPGLAKSLQDADVDTLARQRLIHLSATNLSWTRWSEWFAHQGYTQEIAVGTKVTSYAVALQLASEGIGIALGWKRLIQPLLDSGQLAVVGNQSIDAPHQFYLAGMADADLSANAKLLKDWLLAEVTEASDEFS